MQDVIRYAIYGTLIGVVGTGLGGMLAFFTEKKGQRFLAGVLEFAAGLMLSVVLMDLLPHAFAGATLFQVLVGVLWPLGLTGIWLNFAGTAVLAGILAAVLLLKLRPELSQPDEELPPKTR